MCLISKKPLIFYGMMFLSDSGLTLDHSVSIIYNKKLVNII
jgi:hypothetical protein